MNTIEQFSAYLKESKLLADKYGKRTEFDNLSILLETGKNKQLTLLVCGEFKRGKSSLINALLNQELCPVADGIATSTVSIIRYGEKTKAVRHFSIEDLNEKKLLLQEEEISIDSITKYAKGTSEEIGDTVFIEIETPNPLLKTGLVLVDTPGVGSLDPRHLFLTLQAIPKADAFFYVTDTEEPMTSTELYFIKEKIVPTSKPYDILINKSDQIDKDSLKRFVSDTEKKVLNECAKPVHCISVSAELWKDYNESGDKDSEQEANCEAVHTAVRSFWSRRENAIAEMFREKFLRYLEALKKQVSDNIQVLKTSDNSKLNELRQRLEAMQSLRNMITNENSEFRTKIKTIIEDSQEVVLKEFSQESVLLSSEGLEEILKKPEAAKKDGEIFVTDQINDAIKNLSDNLDKQIDRAINEVMEDLCKYITLEITPIIYNGGVEEGQIVPITHTFSENFVSMTRSALPFIGVTTIATTVAAVPLGLGAGLFGAGLAAVTPLSIVAAAVGVGAGIFYVVQSIRGAKKAERLNDIRKQISPRITIAMNELRSYIQKRYKEFNEEVVKNLKRVAEDMSKQMQEIVKQIQECQQDDQKKAVIIKEMQGHLTMIENLQTHAKVLSTNPFKK